MAGYRCNRGCPSGDFLPARSSYVNLRELLTGVLCDRLLWSVLDGTQAAAYHHVVELDRGNQLTQNRSARAHYRRILSRALYDAEPPGPISDICNSLDREAATILRRHTLCCLYAVAMVMEVRITENSVLS